ncbi:GNAT family N-acetyltransferase [Luteimonas wenzhouensis]|jgi:predicted GNAT family acetyltransferase|uniref:N-acetyltransferase n=1 Tax=Luteimonas wenzhouensis TaxID=2599615 RepID=A0A5C5U3J3_9GAMM|nr:GNAT family N-acetyltransferase [Luteimonas wenzhouensis]NLW97278.1 N-acetyltransferase [Xanthomonadaceae bacterium]TWT20517.1 N-acetyltransferase [Luteimonas wenzhouensis]
MEPIRIEHLAGHRFEAALPGGRAELEYRMSGGRMVILHTGVPEALRGQGVAGRLVEAALEHARAHGLRVEPRCAYAAGWIRRHPEYAALVVGAPDPS